MRWLIFTLLLLFSFNTIGQAPPSRYHKIEVRTVPDSTVDHMKVEKEFRYANDSTYWSKQESQQTASLLERVLSKIGRSSFVRLLLYIFLAAAIIFIAYQVTVVNNFFVFSTARKKKPKDTDNGEVLLTGDLDTKIVMATNEGRYRHAIRFMYLKTLKVLSENNFITLHARSTNQDYIRQMYKHDKLSQFRRLTRIYEYVWYGEFNPDENQFQAIKIHFNDFNPLS